MIMGKVETVQELNNVYLKRYMDQMRALIGKQMA